MAKSRVPDTYTCKCGFTATTAIGFQRHQRTAGKSDDHRLVSGTSHRTSAGGQTQDNHQAASVSARQSAKAQDLVNNVSLTSMTSADVWNLQSNQWEEAPSSKPLGAAQSIRRLFGRKGEQALRSSQPELSQALQQELDDVLQPLRALSQPNIAEALQLDVQHLLQQPAPSGSHTPPMLAVEGLPADNDELLNLLVSASPVLPAASTTPPPGVHMSWSLPNPSPADPEPASETEELLRSINSLPPVAPEPWEGANAPMPSGEPVRVSSLRRQTLQVGGQSSAQAHCVEDDVLQPLPLLGGPALRRSRTGARQDGGDTTSSSRSTSGHSSPAGECLSQTTSPRSRRPALQPPGASTSPQLSRQPSGSSMCSQAPGAPGGRLGSVLSWAVARASRQWDSTRASLAPYLPHVSDEQVEQMQERPEELARQVEAVLAWRDPWLSTRVLAAGLYLLICARHFFGGSNFLQPTTALCSLVLLLMLYTHLARLLRPFLRPYNPASAPGRPLQPAVATTAEVQRAITESIMRVCRILVPYASACLALAYQAVTTRRLAPAVSIVCMLWTVMLLGEMGAFSQWSLLLLLYAGLMTLPLAYGQSQRVVEGLVEEGFRAMAHLLAAANRASLGTAAAVLCGTMAWAPVSVVVRVPMALLLALGVLVWCSGRAKSVCAVSRQPSGSAGAGMKAGAAAVTTSRERRVLRARA